VQPTLQLEVPAVLPRAMVRPEKGTRRHLVLG
jgi:hypothetical protein